jgi:hypothetical protein
MKIVSFTTKKMGMKIWFSISSIVPISLVVVVLHTIVHPLATLEAVEAEI